MIDWQKGVEKSKIKRIPYKDILGMSLTNFFIENNYLRDQELLERVLKRIKMRRHLVGGWDWRDIVKNVKISLSARRTEFTMYKQRI